MAEFVNITFNQALLERFANTIGSGPTAANNLDRVVIDPVEVFDGDGAGRWDGNADTYMQLASNSKFDIGDTKTLFMGVSFMILRDGRYAIAARRNDQNNRWHLILDTSTPATPTLEFFANDAGVVGHNLSNDFSAKISTVTLGKWHTFEMLCVNEHIDFWLDGTWLVRSTDTNGPPPLTIDVPTSPVTIGYANENAGSGITDATFDRYIDSIIFDDAVPAGYATSTDHIVRTWTGNVERLELFGAAKTPQPNILDQTVFPNNIPDFELASNQCFIAGLEPMRKIDQSSVIDVGVDLPGTVNFSAGSVGTNYDYVVTWLDARENESGPSPVSAKRSGITNTITQPASPPSQAAFWRVYRRHASAGQGLHYLISSNIPIGTTSFVEASAVESLTLFAPLQGSDKPPTANHISYNAGRMYYGNVKDSSSTRYPTRVYYSNINELEQVGVNSWFYVGDDDSEIITGLVRFRGNTVIFKETSMYIALGDPTTNSFEVIDISLSIGCVAHQTIKEVGNRLIWMADEGVYAWSGDGDPILISENIEPFFENMPDGRKPYASAGIDLELGLYLLSLSLDKADENDRILCYNYRDSFQDGEHRWSRWLVPVSVLGEGFVGDGRNPRVFFADKNGKVGKFERGLDLNSGIDFKWKTGRFNPWNVGSPMIIHYLTSMVDLITTGNRRINVGYEIDEVGEQLRMFDNPTKNNLKVKVGTRGDYVSIVISGVDIRERIRMYGFKLDGNAIGKR